MIENEKHLLERLELLDSIPSLRRIGPNPANRSKHMASLHTKAALGWQPEWQRALEAGAARAAAADEAKQELLTGPPTAHPARAAGIHTLLASHAEQARGRARVQSEAAVIRRALAVSEARRAAHAADARTRTGSAIGAHERGLAHIAKINGSE